MRRVVSLRVAGAIVAAVGLGVFGLTALQGHTTAAPAGFAVSGPGAQLAAGAATKPGGLGAPALPAGVQHVCATPKRPGQMECAALGPAFSAGHRILPAAQAPLTAAQLQAAYNLTTAGLAGTKVAVVDAFADPNAVADLASYRQAQGLPACDTTTGAGCLTVLNQSGGTDVSQVPQDSSGGWEFEESLDVDMVSAICPNCRIVLLEANSNFITDLGAAENSAVSVVGARFVSNSWNGGEFFGEDSFDNTYFNHRGVAITVASGDFGFGTGWPAVSQFVTSIGGTTLTMTNTTRVGETVWSGSGSGCAMADPKPTWQADTNSFSGCLNRTENDIAAVADPNTPVAVFDTFGGAPGPTSAGGTSVATPIIASVYALAGQPAAATYPARYIYSHAATSFNDVTSGTNGTCESFRAYLCHGVTGFDGPTGRGTPNGVSGFTAPTSTVVTLADPGTRDYLVGDGAFLQIRGLDSAGRALTYTATGLPAGLSINTTTGAISGKLTTATSPSGNTVTVTAKDTAGVTSSVKFRWVVHARWYTGYSGSGQIKTANGWKCVEDPGSNTTNGTVLDISTCTSGSNQRWTVGGDSTVRVFGKCMDVFHSGTANGTPVDLFSCNGTGAQRWQAGPGAQLINPQSGKCLTDPGFATANGTKLNISTCTYGANEVWAMPVGPIVSAIFAKCLDDPFGNTTNGTQFQLYSCNGHSNQLFTLVPNVANADVTVHLFGKCIDALHGGTTDGTVVQLYSCNGTLPQQWVPGPHGEIANVISGKCISAPGTSPGNGTKLVLADCYGTMGDLWHIR